MNDQITKHKAECMNVKSDAEGEISRLRESLEDTRKDQDTLLDEQASLYEFRITHKEDELAQKTAVLTAREIELKSIPSDADFKIKKLREECIEKIKKGHVEIESVKATNIKLNGELKISNSALDNKITEIVSMKENNENLKKSFLVNINSQKHAMDKTLEGRDVIINKRDTRISELEAIIKKDRN
jgi:ASC-1-like (ASCH) protein